MRKFIFFVLSVGLNILFVLNSSAISQVVPPKARSTSQGGSTIDRAQSEDAIGSKPRVAVSKFIDKSAKGKSYGAIGDGMAEMLANALFASNRFIVLERQALDDVMKEQDLGASGRVKTETAAPIGEIEGANLLVEGTITEFEPGTSGAGGGVVGRTTHRGIGGIFAGVTTSHVALIVKVIDAKTSRRLASEQIEGKATDVAGGIGVGGPVLAAVFGGFSKTPMEKAIRVAIEEAVRIIAAKTSQEYYRTTSLPQSKDQPVSTTPLKASLTPSPTQAQPQTSTSATPTRIIYVIWPTASLREGPSTGFKALVEVKKGTGLSVLEEKGQWFRIRLEDGLEGWIGKATTGETP